jgi:putative ABC transport system permease protein
LNGSARSAALDRYKAATGGRGIETAFVPATSGGGFGGMTSLRYILSSLRHFWRIHLAVVLGVSIATAVLTGALLVGDSMRGSLRDLTLQRLGSIDTAIVSPHLFRAQLADEVAANVGKLTQSEGEARHAKPQVNPAILLNGTLQSGDGRNARRATSVSVIGYVPNFWSFGKGGPERPLAEGEVAITQSLGAELEVKAGDNVLLRIPAAGGLPADSPLGAKQSDKTTRSQRLKVVAVLPPVGLARFGLLPSQQLPRNIFLPLDAVQRMLGKPGKANAIFVAGRQESGLSDRDQKILHDAFEPRLDDFGVRVATMDSPTKAELISSAELVLPDAVVQAAEKSFSDGKLQPVVTYLANTIVAGDSGHQRKIPYSIITGIDSLPGIGPLLDADGKPIRLADDQIVLNRWATDDLQAKVDDKITVTFYEPESTHGKLREHRPAEFTLRAIVDLKTKDGKPTAAADPRLTPEMPGVTDRKSISDWDLPFELVEAIRPQDETYWNEYRTTPKAFVSLATAKRLFMSRWGTISLIRIPIETGDAGKGIDLERFRRAIDPAAVGMQILPVKKLGLEAAAGTTSFGLLFLGFSFFLIASAVMLVAILFQLGIQQRSAELGTLAAVGIGRRRIARLFSREGIIVAAVGATVGVGAGILYAWLVIFGLRTWWLAAVSTPFIELHVAPQSLTIGWLIGVVVSWITIRLSIRKLVGLPASQLLASNIERTTTVAEARLGKRSWWRDLLVWPTIRIAMLLVATAACVAGFILRGESQAGAFFSSGAAVLILLLGEIRRWMRRPRSQAKVMTSLVGLSAINTARNPGRSSLTIGLVAAASFLIVSVSAFRLETGEAGTGGFELLATSDRPIHYDLNTMEGRRELGLSDEAGRQLDNWHVYSFRVAAGEDASCLNLYQPTQPRMLGVPEAFASRGRFEWAATAPEFSEKPWESLGIDLGHDSAGAAIVPAVLDMSTAVYSLHLKGIGSQLPIRDGRGRRMTAQVVGLLNNSVLQGNLLVSEANFLRLFPDTGGYRFFLMKTTIEPVSSPARNQLAQLLESALGEEGFDATNTRDQLAQFLAVQNTYLSTFQSLGALGLLLGTIGLAVVQLRNVLERRGELALMRAEGFERRRLMRMVMWENAVLLLGGLAVGCIAAAIALIPQWAPHAASVPWGTLSLLLGTIAIVGIVAGWLSTRRALAAPLLPALRGD